MTDGTVLYLWGGYALGMALALTEVVLLHLRYNAIRGHLGWSRRHRQPAAMAQSGADRSGHDATA